MRLLCDENINSAIVNLLEQEGYDVTRVQDELEIGFDDRDIVTHCLEHDRVIVTNDDDFLAMDQHGGVHIPATSRQPSSGERRHTLRAGRSRVGHRDLARHIGVLAFEIEGRAFRPTVQ